MARRLTLTRRGTLAGALAALGAAGPAGAQTAGPPSKMKIGIVGSGRLGSAIGELWVRAGHQVMFASRHPEELRAKAQALGPLASTGTPAEAAAFGDAMLVAVPYGALAQVGRDLAPIWTGKVVLEAGNAVAGRDGQDLAARAAERGIGLLSAELLPGTRVVRVFNNLGAARFVTLSGRQPPMGVPIAADDPEAIRVGERLVRDAGFDPVLVGGLDKASLFGQGQPFWRASQEELSGPDLRARLPR